MTLEQITSTQANIETLHKIADQMSDTLVQQCADYIIARCNNRGGEWLLKEPIKYYERTYKGFRIRKVETHSQEFRNNEDYYLCIDALERWDSIEKDFRWQYMDYVAYDGQHLLGKPNQTNSYVGIVKTYLESK